MDPISDMLTLIRNAQVVRHETVEVPFSKIKHQIAEILEKEGFVSQVEKKGKKNRKIIEIALKYNDNSPAVSGLKKISKPGQRIYKRASELRPVKEGYGLAIVSTSKGIMTGKEAKKNKLGGEVICHIW